MYRVLEALLLICHVILYVSNSLYDSLIDALSSRTSTSAIAEGPRDALSQLKSCHLLHNCTCTKITLDYRKIALSCGIKISPVGSLD